MPMSSVVVGVDVGGKRKGYHAVALAGGQYVDSFQSCIASKVAHWCQEVRATIVGIDAPCTWGTTEGARPAERALMQERIWCFSSPTRLVAVGHPKNHYGWMLAGEALYVALRQMRFRLLDGRAHSGRKLMFETFPHAVVCALHKAVIPAKNKAVVRRALLRTHGIADKALKNIDFVDAAICALTAHHVAAGRWRSYGNGETGLIVVPTVHK